MKLHNIESFLMWRQIFWWSNGYMWNCARLKAFWCDDKLTGEVMITCEIAQDWKFFYVTTNFLVKYWVHVKLRKIESFLMWRQIFRWSNDYMWNCTRLKAFWCDDNFFVEVTITYELAQDLKLFKTNLHQVCIFRWYY